jgi:hypothetical protein
MTAPAAFDSAGRRRSPATLPGYHAGRPPRNKGRLYPADPPTVEEIVARDAPGDRRPTWLAAARADRGALARRPSHPGAARAGRTRPGPDAGGRCSCVTARAVDAARSAWTRGAGTSCSRGSPRGLSCRLGRRSASSMARRAGCPGRARRSLWSSAVWPPKRAFAAGSRRTSCATPMPSSSREGVPLNVIQRQLGHTNLGTTSIYLQGIDTEEIIATVHARRAPMMSATAGLRL